VARAERVDTLVRSSVVGRRSSVVGRRSSVVVAELSCPLPGGAA
jgi:hypothetical protein